MGGSFQWLAFFPDSKLQKSDHQFHLFFNFFSSLSSLSCSLRLKRVAFKTAVTQSKTVKLKFPHCTPASVLPCLVFCFFFYFAPIVLKLFKSTRGEKMLPHKMKSRVIFTVPVSDNSPDKSLTGREATPEQCVFQGHWMPHCSCIRA